MQMFPTVLLAIAALSAQGQTAHNPCAKSGINLSSISSWTPSWPFVDSFKVHRAWISSPTDRSTWDDGRPIAQDANGWVTSLLPGQIAHTLLHDNAQGHYPAGRYVVLYEGQGTLNFRGDATIVSQVPGRIELDVVPTNDGFHVEILSTDSNDYIRNIHVIMPGFENTFQQHPFHPQFLDSLRSFDVIRFMDWENTNGSWQHDWTMRPVPSDSGYALGLGVPIEVMVDLCNELDVDPWFCMSHQYDDNYIDNFAALVASRLEPERTVYVEHSNEVWNSIFPQYHDAVQRAQELNIPGDPFQSAMRYHSQRSVEIFNIWDDYFDQDHLVRVMGAWHSNTWVTSQLLDWNNAAASVDALAVAPYFGAELGVGQNGQTTLNMTEDEVIDACIADIATQRAQTQSQLDTVAQYNNIDLITYESGQHLVGVGKWSNNTQLEVLFIAANRNPRMYDSYMDDITGWFGLGGGLMTAYASCQIPTRYGSWGLLEYQNQPLGEAPKMRAWVDYNTNPADFTVDGQLDFFDISTFITAFNQQDAQADFDNDGQWTFFDVSSFLDAFNASCGS
ncbi:MAG: GC-type dockerin domain-anchored protein [Phycisphaerales bacterium]